MSDNQLLFVESNLPKPLTKKEIYEYFKKYQDGDKSAKEKIIKHNIRLVINLVMTKYATVSYEKKELVSIGLLGLIKAVNTFDTSKNVKFSTYAIKCIDNEILMFLRKSKKYVNDVSFNQSLGLDKDGKELTLEDILISNNYDLVSEYENKEIYAIVRQIVEELPDREREIVMLHFGFVDDKIYTQQEIAKKLNITQSYVFKVKKKVLKKMREILIDNELIESVDKLEKIGKVLPKININEQQLSNLPQKNNETIELNLKKQEKKRMAKKIQSLYEYFNQYTKEEINLMIQKLTDEEKELIRLRYGEDFDNPIVSSIFSKEQRTNFYGCLIPKMRRLLSNPTGKRKTYNKKTKIAEVQKNEDGVNEERGNTSNTILKEDYIRILEMMKTPNFSEMLQVLSPKEAIIICLKLGYVDGKYFTTESLSKFLGIEEEEIREIIKKILLVYKENLNAFIDTAISIATDKNFVLKSENTKSNK